MRAYYLCHISIIVILALFAAGCAHERGGGGGGGGGVTYTPPGTPSAAALPKLKEPTIRIGLKTDATATTFSGRKFFINEGTHISTLSGQATVSVSFVADLSARYSVQVGSFSARENAEAAQKTFRSKIDMSSYIAENPDSHMFQLRAGPFPSKDKAQQAIEQIRGSGYPNAFYVSESSVTSNQLPQLVVRREDGEVISKNRSSVQFWSEDGTVTIDNVAYRGYASVFVNKTGRLTVVNVLNFEDYLKGVVPNEIGPASTSTYEALKAQAVAARTYAQKNLKQFESDGYDICATASCQVYNGIKTENSLTSQAVQETAGEVITYQGLPINALYTSTCGGRTEDASIMFEGWNYPYLRSVECNPEENDTYQGTVEIAGKGIPWWLAWLQARTGLQPLGPLQSAVSVSEAQRDVASTLQYLGKTSCNTNPLMGNDWISIGQYLVDQLCWQNKRDSLLNEKDYQYFVTHLNFSVSPSPDSHSFLFLFHDDILRPVGSAAFRPMNAMSRSDFLQALYRVLDHYHQINSRDGQVRQIDKSQVQIVDDLGVHTYSFQTSPYLFQQIGDQINPRDRVACGPGDHVQYYLNGDVIQIFACELHPNGVSADKTSKYSFWQEAVSPSELGQRISRYLDVGTVVDLQPLSYGTSHRIYEMKIVGTKTSGVLKGIRIRWALGLKDNLFVVDRTYDGRGSVKQFLFTGRGWGHGVGMCQVGAIGFAKMGKDYRQILQHYYSGVQITKVY